jgi:uncharacterized membrane protein
VWHNTSKTLKGNAMSHERVLVLSVFDDEQKADEAAAALKKWDKADEDIKLGGIGILVKDADGKIKEHKVGPRQGGKGARVGLLLGVVAAIPTGGLSLAAGAASGVVGGGILGSFVKKGFKEMGKDEAERIDKELDAGHAALGVLVSLPDADAVSDELTRLGGQSETHVISDDEMQEVNTAAESAMPTQPPTETSSESTPPQS